MIERRKTITYEVRSHRQKTVLSDKGKFIDSDLIADFGRDTGAIKRMMGHLQDILKCIKRIKKENEKNKEKLDKN